MFKEIETELLSIISDDTIEQIAHMPTKEIAKTMELLYNIKFEDIKRVYKQPIDDITIMTIVYDANGKTSIDHDLCPINGKLYHITLFPESLLNKDENNAVMLSRAIITYTSCRVGLVINKYSNFMKYVEDNSLFLIALQAIPVITCGIMRRIYSGPTLSKLIYMSLCELMDMYKTQYTEQGIDSVLSLFDEGLGVSELLDSGFICSIKVNDSKYPGIWSENTNDDNND